MPRKKKTKEEVEETDGVAIVEWRGKSRDYTTELHGADYKKLAQQFAEKKGGTVK